MIEIKQLSLSPTQPRIAMGINQLRLISAQPRVAQPHREILPSCVNASFAPWA